jgi:hypothetical protein
MPLESETITLARAVRIEDEIRQRGIKLRRLGHEWVGPCAVCGGTDRFSINTRKQVFNCRGTGGGSVIDLVMHLDGCDFATAITRLAGIEPGRPTAKHDPARIAAAKAKAEQAEIDDFLDENEKWWRAVRIWEEAVLIEGTPADVYLRLHRHLDLPDGVSGRVLRFHPACPFGKGTYPCMVALVRNIGTNAPQAIHRTALHSDGTPVKIDGKTARLALGSTRNGAVKLTDDAEVTTGLFVGEGIETVLAGTMAPRWWRPAWAVLYAANIASFPVLAGIECLTVMVDHDLPDKNGRRAGQTAAEECRRRWAAAEREVIGYIPTHEGFDIADVGARKA